MKPPFSIRTFKPAHLMRGWRGDRYVTDKFPSFSPILNRNVHVDVFRPLSLLTGHRYPLLLLNDGQDAEAVQVKQALEKLWQREEIEPVIAVGIHAADRMHEYGVAVEKDFSGRGYKAAIYTQFILEELLPYLHSRYMLNQAHQVIAGYSLGALSAVDIAWSHPDIFCKVGAFSGSFWWRRLDSADENFDEKKHRIMHNQIRDSEIKPGLKFWFQTGTRDEPHDRNENGVIDSIDDTLDLIAELIKKGYRPFYDIVYHEVKGGEHNQHTWAKAMPYFLRWAFPMVLGA